ncbi:cobyrinate a,c-diamide synthase [Desulfotalea psychrophila]|nr:cobyrinate a,c-diamide synthase [Desulfotalea psychrophila]
MKGTKGIVVAGLSGGSGKSIVSVGLTAALIRSGAEVVPFKKGPDYIDAGWLQEAAKGKCYNLDPFFMEEEAIRSSFVSRAAGADYAIVEGNRGLYDGVNVEGGFSTAELAINLGLPVLLVVNCTKTTRTIAALVLGCKLFDPRVNICGVVLNQIATGRQRKIVVEAVEKYTGIPVVGTIPRTRREVFPMRHLGMVPHQEYGDSDAAVEFLADLVEEHLDLEQVKEMMVSVEAKKDSCFLPPVVPPSLRIGVIRDAAFQFYYSENLEALERGGAELVYLDAIHDAVLPELDGLYIGGGFPETSAAALAANTAFLHSLRDAVEADMPVYAECGGLIYLGQTLVLGEEEFTFAGIFPSRFGMSKKPQAHGYSIFEVEGENPYYSRGLEVKGHEFRYSTVLGWDGDVADLCLKMTRGTGFRDGRDGLCYKNVLAMYTHVHADGTPQWTEGFLARCRQAKKA